MFDVLGPCYLQSVYSAQRHACGGGLSSDLDAGENSAKGGDEQPRRAEPFEHRLKARRSRSIDQTKACAHPFGVTESAETREGENIFLTTTASITNCSATQTSIRIVTTVAAVSMS
eukprot:GHVU01144677.1.p1 GENE.GHVU01144677.1~~GHVU01144677.1.p1  ORF type:complete len:116 (-),score=7.99 GHVU01144677.1:64-411(-)